MGLPLWKHNQDCQTAEGHIYALHILFRGSGFCQTRFILISNEKPSLRRQKK